MKHSKALLPKKLKRIHFFISEVGTQILPTLLTRRGFLWLWVCVCSFQSPLPSCFGERGNTFKTGFLPKSWRMDNCLPASGRREIVHSN